MAQQQVAAAVTLMLVAVYSCSNVDFTAVNCRNHFVYVHSLSCDTFKSDLACKYAVTSSSYSGYCNPASDARIAAIADVRRRPLLIVRRRLRYTKSPVCYYNNTDATFNLELGPLLLMCGDIQSNPGPDHTSTQQDQPRRMDVQHGDGDQHQSFN